MPFTVLIVEPSMLEFNDCNNYGYLNRYLYLDTIIITEDFDKKCFSYRKVMTRHVYLWRGLTRYL